MRDSHYAGPNLLYQVEALALVRYVGLMRLSRDQESKCSDSTRLHKYSTSLSPRGCGPVNALVRCPRFSKYPVDFSTGACWMSESEMLGP